MSLIDRFLARFSQYGSRIDKRNRLQDLLRTESKQMNEFGDLLLPVTAERIRAISNEYAADHAYYVNNISDSLAAISLKQVGFLAWLIRQRKPQKVLDTGSGFSSYVFRKEQHNESERHLAVEDHDGWRQKTKDYLTQKHLSPENVLLWQDCQSNPQLHGQYDLIYHDMGNMTTRIVSLPTIITWLAPRGILVLDDMHKATYHPHALQLLKDHQFIWSSLVKLTADEYGRFAFITRRNIG